MIHTLPQEKSAPAKESPVDLARLDLMGLPRPDNTGTVSHPSAPPPEEAIMAGPAGKRTGKRKRSAPS